MNQCRYLALLPLLLFCACSKSSRPADLPPLFPCTVSVTQGGSPLEGAYVELLSQDAQKYRPSAAADASGKATLLTYGFPGAPAGKYKVLVRKTIEDDIVYSTDEYGTQSIASSNRYELVDDLYHDATKTPHEIDVASKKIEITIDVGSAVRKKLAGSQ